MQLKKAHLLYINFFVLLSVLASAQPQTVDGVAAIVGGDVILKSDIDEQYDVFNRQNFGKPVSYCEVFEELLFQKLLIHHAAIDSISIGEEEVEANMDRRIQQLIMQMGDQKKLEDFYEKSELSQIVKFPELSDEAEQEVIAKLKELKERIENGTSFSSMAILYSEDPGSNKKGGEYQGIQRGVFVKEFEAVAFNLRKGEISDPFKTEFGYHIVQLLEKRGEELDLRHILIKPKLTQENLQEAKNFLDSVSVAIANGEMTFEEASRRFSDDEQTRFNGGQMSNFQSGNNKFEVSQLDRGLFALISSLEDDEISEASFYRTEDQREAFRIVRLDANYEPHKANLDLDFTRIKGFALQQKQAKTVEDWKNEKLADTFVKINEGYYDCADELNSWNSNND